MAIDFNKQLVFDPKIDIVGEEVPLAEMEKTGNVLQDRYDKSYENYSKFQELAKQSEQIANELEREKAKEWIKSLEPQIKEIRDRGDFHNMRWQTMALANNAANNLALFGERSKLIQANMNAIAAAKDIKDPKARKYYQNLINEEVAKTTYNPETKTFDFKAINMPNLVGDFDYTKLSFDAASGWNPTSTGFSNDKIQVVTKTQYDKNGNILKVPGVYNVKTGQQVVGVEKEEVVNSLKEILAGSPGALEAIERDVDIFMKSNPEANREQVYQEIYSNKVLKPINAAAEKESFENKNNIYSEDYANEGVQKAFGFGNVDNTSRPLSKILQSDPVPGEGNEVLSNFGKKSLDQIFYKLPLLEGKGPFGGYGNYGEILAEAKPQLFFISKSLKDQAAKLKTSKDPNDKVLYEKIVASGALSIYDKLSKNQSPSIEFVDNLIKKINNGELNNVAIPSAYKFVTGDDVNFRTNELDRQFPDKKGDPVAQMKQLNFMTLGNEDGLDITKKGDVAMTLQGWDLLNPLTGEYNTASAAIQGKGDGLKIGTPTRDQTMMRVIGKAIPGTVLNATSKTPYGDLSHFGEAYVVSVNGENLLMANRNNRGNLNSRLNDLATFSRTMREDTDYKTLTPEGKTVDVKIKSDGNNITVTTNNTSVSVPNELYLTALEQARQIGIDPVFYLTTIKP
jgi:hypothetical protein